MLGRTQQNTVSNPGMDAPNHTGLHKNHFWILPKHNETIYLRPCPIHLIVAVMLKYSQHRRQKVLTIGGALMMVRV